MSDQERYLAQAVECERMAKRSASKEDSATLRHMAKLWTELAETAAALEWRDEVTSQLGDLDEIS